MRGHAGEQKLGERQRFNRAERQRQQQRAGRLAFGRFASPKQRAPATQQRFGRLAIFGVSSGLVRQWAECQRRPTAAQQVKPKAICSQAQPVRSQADRGRGLFRRCPIVVLWTAACP